MKKIILGSLAALALTLAVAVPQASAAWVTRPVTYWDANCGRYVTTTQTYWVPGPVVVPYRHHVHYYHGHRHEGHHGHHHR
jgi:hypothetical protein